MMKRHVSSLILFTLLWPSAAGAAWIARPGTVKVIVRKMSRVAFPPLDLPLQRLRDIAADVVEDRETSAELQLIVSNASASPRSLEDIADVVEVRNLPHNRFVVLGDSNTLKRFVERFSLQLFRLHQPFPKGRWDIFDDCLVSLLHRDRDPGWRQNPTEWKGGRA
jgi:hypothetical protein